jgi:hypothetical protein
MIDGLRALLDEPLDPRIGRAVVVLASAILLGLAALFILADREPDTSTRAEAPSAASSMPSSPAAGAEPLPVEEGLPPRWRQDPQDEAGSPAARRAGRALASHRALQHVPYRNSELVVDLVGARGHRAILRVSANTVQAAREGWRRFLRLYRDSGRAYLPRFEAEPGGSPRREVSGGARR